MRLALFFMLAFLTVIFLPAMSTAIDKESIECLGCHDAAIATDVTLQVCSQSNCDHPFGVDYSVLAKVNRGLHPVNALP